MFPNLHASVSSVTYFDGDPPEVVKVRKMLDYTAEIESSPGFSEWSVACQDSIKAAMAQKRLDKSVANEKVRALLNAARIGGMSQRDFELAAAELRPSSGRGVGFNGRLWHHYLTTDARMSMSTFNEYCGYFLDKGWISELQHRDAQLCLESSQVMLTSAKSDSKEIKELVRNHPGMMSTKQLLFMLAGPQNRP